MEVKLIRRTIRVKGVKDNFPFHVKQCCARTGKRGAAMLDEEGVLKFIKARQDLDFAMVEAWAKTVDLSDEKTFVDLVFEAQHRCLELNVPQVYSRVEVFRKKQLEADEKLLALKIIALAPMLFRQPYNISYRGASS